MCNNNAETENAHKGCDLFRVYYSDSEDKLVLENLNFTDEDATNPSIANSGNW